MVACDNCHLQIVELLLREKADPNVRNNAGWTALMYASDIGDHQMVKMLLKKGADPNIPSMDGLTSVISYNGHLQVVALLLQACADPNMYNNAGWTALMFAIQNGYLQLAKLLVKEKANPNTHSNEGCTPLMVACGSGQLQIVELLLEQNADPNIQSNKGVTALMFARQTGYLQVVELLLKENADPNAHSNTGLTPLLLASKNSHSNVVVMLLQYKANPHVKSFKHLDSFTIAAFKGNTDIVNTFLNHSEIRFESLSMGWYYACQFGHVPIIALLSHRIDIVSDQTDIIISCAEGDLGTVVDQLMSGKMTPDDQFIHGITPLMISSSCGHNDIVEALIQSGADINKTDEFGYTALDYAELAKQATTRLLLLQYDGLRGIDFDSKVRTTEESLLKTIDDISTEKDISNLQQSLNISSIARYLEESIATQFSKHQSADYTNNPLTLDLNDLNCD